MEKFDKYNITPISFQSRNASVRKADNVCRNIRKEFPVYSNTAMDRFVTINKTPASRKIYSAVSDLIEKLRNYYNDDEVSIIKMLAGMKKAKVGNCFEQSTVANLSLQLNGFKDVRQGFLVAYNPKSNNIRDLDHTIAVTNLKIPKNYKYATFSDENLTVSQLIKPDNNSIIVDAWAGFADNAGNSVARYKSDVALSSPLEEGEELRLILYPDIKLNNSDKKFLQAKYPGLVLEKNKNQNNNNNILNNETYQVLDIDDAEIANIKKNNQLKSSGFQNAPVPEVKPKSFLDKVSNFISEFFL